MVFQEIYQFHAVVGSKRSKGNSGLAPSGANLSKACQEFLGDLLRKRPAVCHCLIQHLMRPASEKNCSLLHNVYLQTLLVLLAEITSVAKDNDETVSRFCDILALFDPPERTKGPALAKFLEDLYVACESGSLRLECIYSCLVGKDSQFLLKEFCDVQWETSKIRFEKDVAKGEGYSAAARTLLGLSNENALTGRYPWRNLFLLCLANQRHFLDVLIVSCDKSLVLFIVYQHVSSHIDKTNTAKVTPNVS